MSGSGISEGMDGAAGGVPDLDLAVALEGGGARLGLGGFVEEEIDFAVFEGAMDIGDRGTGRIQLDVGFGAGGDDFIGDVGGGFEGGEGEVGGAGLGVEEGFVDDHRGGAADEDDFSMRRRQRRGGGQGRFFG